MVGAPTASTPFYPLRITQTLMTLSPVLPAQEPWRVEPAASQSSSWLGQNIWGLDLITPQPGGFQAEQGTEEKQSEEPRSRTWKEEIEKWAEAQRTTCRIVHSIQRSSIELLLGAKPSRHWGFS